MVVYNFKTIKIVPGAKEFVDTVLTRTQRGTPTVVHPQFKISRIRSFYMRKVRYTQQNFHDKLSEIVDKFPKLDDIHPFYADLINVLYDRDHYKLALGQLGMARTLIDNIARDYIRLLKVGDSLFKCKSLKRAAMGRMCTLIRRHNANLQYLEEVRKHLSRLPSIDPSTRTVIMCGYPNVGKSSFMNAVTRADVEVKAHAFTTKSLFVGHMDYRYRRYQVIDTPGVLDHPLEERNTIEMQAITALAHLQCAVLYVIDPSEKCGYSLEQQLSLFESIKPLFMGKPLLIVANKSDEIKISELKPEARDAINASVEGSGAVLREMSTFTEDGIAEVKATACDMLLEARVQRKLAGRKIGDVMNRLTVAEPAPRDDRHRGTAIPESVLRRRAAQAARKASRAGGASGAGAEPLMVYEDKKVSKSIISFRPKPGDDMDIDMDNIRRLERDLERDAGGPGAYISDYRKTYLLKEEEWKYDAIPEIMDGKNVADYIDPEIWDKLRLLEEEEAAATAEEAQKAADEIGLESDEDPDEHMLASEIRHKREFVRRKHADEMGKNRSKLPLKHRARRDVTAARLKERVEEQGFDPALAEPPRGRKRTRMTVDVSDSDSELEADADMNELAGTNTKRVRSKSRARSASRSKSRAPSTDRRESGIKTKATSDKLQKLAKRTQRRTFNRQGKIGEADRFIGTKMPKHLFSGKRGIGTTDWR